MNYKLFKELFPDRIIQQHHHFPDDQFFKEFTMKNQVVWHHTVSGPGVTGDIGWWKQTKERVATPVIIDYLGVLHKLFEFGYWAHHLGVKMSVFDKYLNPNIYYYDRYTHNALLNRHAFGIELDNWGPLVFNSKTEQFIASPNNFGTTGQAIIVPYNRVVELDSSYKGYIYWERYTEEQLESAAKLTAYIMLTNNVDFNIPQTQAEYYKQMFEVNAEALIGKPGLYTHNSYREDKSDIAPQLSVYPAMLESKRLFDKYA